MKSYKIINKSGQYIYRTDKTVSFTSKDNATEYSDLKIAEDYLKRMELFYGGNVEFYLEEV